MKGQNHSLLRLRSAEESEPSHSLTESALEEPTLQAVLVTDLVAFTPLLLRMGDHDGLQVIRLHNAVLRDCFKLHAGREVAHTGDGIMAAFRSVRRSLLCALEIKGRLAAQTMSRPEVQLRIRIGIHLGEPLPEEGRLFGSCVNTAVRICGAAGPGCILVSEIVRQTVQDHQLSFVDRGSVALKGIESLRLYELTRR